MEKDGSLKELKDKNLEVLFVQNAETDNIDTLAQPGWAKNDDPLNEEQAENIWVQQDESGDVPVDWAATVQNINSEA